MRPLKTVAIILLIWLLVGVTGVASPLFLPELGQVVTAGLSILQDSSLYPDIWATLSRAATGLIISCIVGIPLGLFFGQHHELFAFFELPIDFLRSIPSSALFFLFILIFGIGNSSKVAVVVYGCAPIMLVGAVYGARPNREKEDRLRMLRIFGATDRQVFRLCVLPDALPQLAAALRVAVSLALVLVIVTEMFLGSNDGLGHRLYDYYLAYRIADMYFVLIILGLIGYAANRFAVEIERRLTFWTPVDSGRIM
jgi:ABC-type nitrate/sulfonate/bicarbonate transport system permease component